ncbi:carbohydrate porin [Vibrio sp. SM6]|uniref:Carbohydrate porin n=1 Tax=Vibrio agarilyticus TaxID=2726741 RepID=A0A7X8TSM3_9VIBR|nr:carbohydrate porin [Vibrio agarilyticus]NLS14058.1 carbohydrate porin [Vibrio agarilyticus]
MKFSKVHLSCLLALAGATTPAVSFAEDAEAFEFNGYFRQGALYSVENDFKDSDFVAQKETLGRLGLEYDNQTTLDFSYRWTFGDGRSLKVGAGIAEGRTAGSGSGFIEITGYTDTGVLFAGKRDYGKERYIWMTDFFYTDMSGTGIGIESMKVGSAIVNAAYMVSQRDDYDLEYTDFNANLTQKPDGFDNIDGVMHAFNLAVKYGVWDISATVKAMPDNWSYDGKSFKEWAETGFDLTVGYKMFSFFGLQNNGSSNTNFVVQAGKGLGAGQLLGGTITSYNAYRPGGLRFGEHEFEWGVGSDAVSLLTNVEDDDVSYRALVFGGHTFANGVGIFPSVQAQYNDYADGTYDYWASAMVRPVMPINDMMYLQGEVGYVYNNWDGDTYNQAKVTIAPTLMFPTWTGVNPEVRFLASWVKNSWTTDPLKGQPENDFVIGIQTEVSW